MSRPEVSFFVVASNTSDRNGEIAFAAVVGHLLNSGSEVSKQLNTVRVEPTGLGVVKVILTASDWRAVNGGEQGVRRFLRGRRFTVVESKPMEPITTTGDVTPDIPNIYVVSLEGSPETIARWADHLTRMGRAEGVTVTRWLI